MLRLGVVDLGVGSLGKRRRVRGMSGIREAAHREHE